MSEANPGQGPSSELPNAAQHRIEAGVVDGQYNLTADQLVNAKEVVSSGDAGSRYFERLNWLNNGGEEPKFQYNRDSAPEAGVQEPVQADPSAAGKELVPYKPVSKELVVPASKEVALRDPSEGKHFKIVDNRKWDREAKPQVAEGPVRVDSSKGEAFKPKHAKSEKAVGDTVDDALDFSKVEGDPKLAKKLAGLEDLYAKLVAGRSRKFLKNMGSVKVQIERDGETVTEKYKTNDIETIRELMVEARAAHRDSVVSAMAASGFPQKELETYFNQTHFSYEWAAKLSAKVEKERIANSKNSNFVQKWAAKTFGGGQGRFGKYLRLALPGYGQFNALRVARNMAGAKVGDKTVAGIQSEAFLKQLNGELDGLSAQEADDFVARDLRHEIGERNVDRNRRRMRTSIELGALTTAVALRGVSILNDVMSNDAVTSAHHAVAPHAGVHPTDVHPAAADKPGHLNVNAGGVHEKWVWGHFSNEYSPAEASGKIAEAAAKAKAAGYDIHGWVGQGDGSRARMTMEAIQHANANKFGFNSIVAPDGHVYDSQQEIAALLDKFKS